MSGDWDVWEPCVVEGHLFLQAPCGLPADKSVYTHLVLPEVLSHDASHPPPQDIWENLCYGEDSPLVCQRLRGFLLYV